MTLKAVIFDWAGTMVDFGSCAPMATFVEIFARHGVAISIAEARGPMGLPKIEHFRALGANPAITARWQAAHDRAFTSDDAQQMLEEFVPATMAAVRSTSALIPGALEAAADARRRGMKIGSNTGYTRAIMDVLAPLAARQGYTPDCIICSDDTVSGRPGPLMLYKAFVDLGVWPASACVKVDDTAPGIAEGLAAGTWTVGLAVSGNAFGATLEEFTAMSAADVSRRRKGAAAALEAAGAHLVIDSVADLPAALDVIEDRRRGGEVPVPR
jgi:phosphonoacetaldehyde hydrolase